MTLQIDEVSIRCVGCSQQQTLAEAVRSGWKMCKHCNFSICSFCQENLGPNRKCISYVCSPKGRAFEPVTLPVDKILIFAQEYAYKEYRQGLLYKLFYEEQERCQAAPFFVIQEKNEEAVSEDLRPTHVQEEVWKNFQLVITKRRGGKFITWEKVY
jgi:hypothetical protein